jgi:hypothetical protein
MIKEKCFYAFQEIRDSYLKGFLLITLIFQDCAMHISYEDRRGGKRCTWDGGTDPSPPPPTNLTRRN